MPAARVAPRELIVPRLTTPPVTEEPATMMPVFRNELLLPVMAIVPLFVTLPVTVLPVIKMPTFEFAVALIEPVFVMLPVTVLLPTSTPWATTSPVADIAELLTMSPVIVELATLIPAAKVAATVIVPELVIAACVPPATFDRLMNIPVAAVLTLLDVTVIASCSRFHPKRYCSGRRKFRRRCCCR